MMQLMTDVIALSASAVLAAFVILIAIDVVILRKLRSSFPQQPCQNSRTR